MLAMFLGTGLYIYLEHREKYIRRTIHNLSDSLYYIENGEEQLALEDDLFGVLRDEIYKSLTSQKYARDEAVKARKQLKRNMEDVTHQIKTPLTGIILLLDLLKSDPDHAEEYQERIRQKIDSLRNLSDLLLKLSSLDTGSIVMQHESFSVKGLVIDAEISLDLLLHQKNIQVEVHGEDFTLKGDRVWLLEALTNLVKNAIEASPDESIIEILIGRNLIYQNIIVRDYGPGLTMEQQERVFERFYKSNPKSKGFGIGLSLAKSIIQEHDGELLVRSSSKGSEFEMRFYPCIEKVQKI